MRKIISLFLLFSILTLSGNLFSRERNGVEIYIQKKNSQYVRGELIAVKKNSLLVKHYISEGDVTVDVRDIGVINILRESKALEGGVAGFILGGVIGYLIGYPQGDEGGFVIISKSQAGGIGAAIGGVSCAVVGAAIGAAVGIDKKIQFEGKSDSEIQSELEKLSKKARVPDYQ